MIATLTWPEVFGWTFTTLAVFAIALIAANKTKYED